MGTPNAKRIALFAPKDAILMAGAALIVRRHQSAMS